MSLAKMAGPREPHGTRGPFYGMIDKPNSVPSTGGDHLSGSDVAIALEQPTRSLCLHPFLTSFEALYSGRN